MEGGAFFVFFSPPGGDADVDEQAENCAPVGTGTDRGGCAKLVFS